MAKVCVSLRCSCGAVRGVTKDIDANSGTRVVCYCDDCQAFANYLDRPDEILDEHGGTDIFQLPPSEIEITVGLEQIRCIKLSSKGTYRWYTACCKTPVGNTMGPKFPFVGVIHNFMDAIDRDQVLGLPRARVQAQHAKGSLPEGQAASGFPVGITLRIMSRMLGWKLKGKGSPTPFFDSNGTPVSEPQVLS